MIVDRILIYDSSKGETGEKILRIPVNVALLKVENRSGTALTIQGSSDIPPNEDAVYYSLGGIRVDDYSQHVNFVNNMYSVEVSGLSYIKLNLAGTGDVYLTMVS